MKRKNLVFDLTIFSKENEHALLVELYKHADPATQHGTFEFITRLFELRRSLAEQKDHRDGQRIVVSINKFLEYFDQARDFFFNGSIADGHFILRQIEDTLINYRQLFKDHPACPYEALQIFPALKKKLNVSAKAFTIHS